MAEKDIREGWVSGRRVWFCLCTISVDKTVCNCAQAGKVIDFKEDFFCASKIGA